MLSEGFQGEINSCLLDGKYRIIIMLINISPEAKVTGRFY